MVRGGALTVIAVGVIALLYTAGRDTDPAFIDPANRSLVVQGQPIYEYHCASCHGVTLQGQPEWRKRRADGKLPAPPHDQSGHTWHHSDGMLFDMVKDGLVPGITAPPGYKSDMPAYGQILADAEIIAVLAYIKSNWPANVLQAQKATTMRIRNQ